MSLDGKYCDYCGVFAERYFEEEAILHGITIPLPRRHGLDLQIKQTVGVYCTDCVDEGLDGGDNRPVGL